MEISSLENLQVIQEATLFEHNFIASRYQEVKSGEFYFYHLAPIGIDLHEGLMSPTALHESGRHQECIAALEKYRERMVYGWAIFPGRDPYKLTETELLRGLEKFRGVGGGRTIYFFRYLPQSYLGKGMNNVIKHKDGYRINLDDPGLKKCIESISWGWVDSYTQNIPYSEDYYRKVTEKEYFSKYNDNPQDGTPRFAPIPHIGITFYDGICPRKFLTKVMHAGKLVK